MTEFRHIVRIAGTDLDGSKPVYIALKGIKGVSFMFSNAVAKALNIDRRKRLGELSEKEIQKIEEALSNPIKYGIPPFLLNRRKDYATGEDKHLVSSDLELTQDMDIKRLQKIKSYRGIRHALHLPVRGQRTKSGYTRPPFRKQRRQMVVGVKRRKVK
ncbi:30S ribosomal protein S13 [Nanoarchaeota archaeon]|nr:MAG: 30S ribosomal protein S13 [Nanoarchaeota archaeon]